MVESSKNTNIFLTIFSTLGVTIYTGALLYFLEKKFFESNKNHPTTMVPFFCIRPSYSICQYLQIQSQLLRLSIIINLVIIILIQQFQTFCCSSILPVTKHTEILHSRVRQSIRRLVSLNRRIGCSKTTVHK